MVDEAVDVLGAAVDDDTDDTVLGVLLAAAEGVRAGVGATGIRGAFAAAAGGPYC